MQHLIEFKDWVINLGKRHHVNPIIFGALYIVGKLSFLIFTGWTIRSIRANRPYLVTLLIALVGYCLPMTYIIIAGRDIPWWVYSCTGLVALYGVFVAWRKMAAHRQR